MKRLFTIFAALSVTCIMNAQDRLSLPLAREASVAAVRVIDAYDSYCRVSKVTNQEFMNLFSNPELEIYNDLTGLSPQKYLSVSDYADIIISNAKSCKTVITDVEKEKIYVREDGKVVIPVKMSKSIQYLDSRGVFFSSKEIFDADHIIHMDIVYNPDESVAYIESLTGQINSQFEFPEPYDVILSCGDHEIDSLIRYKDSNGVYQALKFNSRWQAFVPGGIPESDWRSWDPSNIQLIFNKDENGLSNYKARHQNGRFCPYGAISLMSPMKLSNEGNYVKSSSITYEGGFDFGVMITARKQTHFGMFTGLGYSCTIFNFERNISDLYNTADAYGKQVTVSNNANLSQSLTTQWFYIPVFFRLEFISWRRIKPQIDFGIRFYANPSWMFNDNTIFYSGFNTIHAVGTLSGESYDRNILHQTSYTDLSLAQWYLSGFASLGLDVSVTKRLGAFVNLSYEMSFYSNLKNSAIVVNSISGDVKNPVSYMFSSGDFQAYGTLAPSFSATKMALMMKLGLSLKF